MDRRQPDGKEDVTPPSPYITRSFIYFVKNAYNRNKITDVQICCGP